MSVARNVEEICKASRVYQSFSETGVTRRGQAADAESGHWIVSPRSAAGFRSRSFGIAEAAPLGSDTIGGVLRGSSEVIVRP
jgi:hypothetical protein